MTADEAWLLEVRWGAPGPAPEADWRCCYRCGEWNPPGSRFWCVPHRLCRACKADEKRGIWPYTPAWHRKNRWGPDGHLLRRCCACGQWKRLTEYYVMRRNDAKRRTHRLDPMGVCIRCNIARKGYISLPELRAELRARRAAATSPIRRLA